MRNVWQIKTICQTFFNRFVLVVFMGLVETVKEFFNEGRNLGSQLLYHGKEIQGKLELPFSPSRDTVLLTHGYGARGRSMEYLAKKLHKDGFNAVPLYYFFWEDLEVIGLELVKSIREYYQKQISARKIHLVAHSMGGLISCAASRIVPEMVESATFLGTPFGGTRRARWGIGKSAEQILPGSKYLQNLLQEGLPEEVHYNVVQGIHDKVVPCEKGCLPLKQDNIRHYLVDAGHLGLTGRKGYQVVRRVLSVDSCPFSIQ